ncbi:MAG: ABC transporter ATP-binding protein [Clostridia bacterium]|nr:ABC transporter ATP-binding protein [Clostridia bacterium]
MKKIKILENIKKKNKINENNASSVVTEIDAVKETGTQNKNKIIEVQGITKIFDNVTVLDKLSLSIKKGQFVTLLGPSGCGKTTLLRIIAGFETPTEGKVFISGKDMTNVPPFKRPVNTVFQKYALFPHLNVFNNIAYGLKLQRKDVEKDGKIKKVRLSKTEIKEKVETALKLVNLEGYGFRDVTSLSGGQQQRVAIARALVLQPDVLLLDEPLGALDLKMRKEMQTELISMHNRIGITFIYVTHDQEEALTMSDVVVVINDGVIQQIGAPKKIYDEPANAFVANFIGESNLLSGTMLKDYTVEVMGSVIKCMDKGFKKNEKVDMVVRPEDIKVYLADAVDKEGNPKGQFDAEVVSTVFKGTFYQMEIQTQNYEWTVQSTKEYIPGQKVRIGIEPEGIHIMKKLRYENSFIGTIVSENVVRICDGDFEFESSETFERDEEVKVVVPFDAVELTDDENDGVIGANVTQSIYKGNYYQVQVYTDTDEDFYIDTKDEWDNDDRVGIKIDKTKIKVEKITKEDKEEE